MYEYQDCIVCNPEHQTMVIACMEANAAEGFGAACYNPSDYSYAIVYYDSMCGSGGYISYNSTPHEYIYTPPANCTIKREEGTKRAVKMVA